MIEGKLAGDIAHFILYPFGESGADVKNRNILLNGLQDRAEAINCALGAEKGKANISSYSDSNIGTTQLSNAGNGMILTRCLDDFQFDGDVRLI